MPIPLAIPIAAAGAKLAFGAYQTYNANKRLKNLGAMPEYELTPEMINSQKRAERMARTGYTPQESASFYQRLARGNRTAFQRGLSIGGGGISQALNSAVLANNIGANLDFTANDAALKRRNIQYADQRGDVITGQRNKNVYQQLAYRMMLEQALGQAKSQGQMNMVESITDLPWALMYNEKTGSGERQQAPQVPMLPPRKVTPMPIQTGNWGVDVTPVPYNPYILRPPMERRY